MGWAEIVVAGTVGIIASQCAIHVIERSKERLLSNLIPRFFLLEAFYEMQSRLPFLYEEQWTLFYDKIKRVLVEIQVVVGETSTEKSKLTRGLIKRVSLAVDTHLLSYLHSQTQLAELLREYLPASGQSWAAFLHERENLERNSGLSFQLRDTKEEREEALENMRRLVSSFLYDLKEINSSISTASRGKTSITDPSFIEPPSTYAKVKVHYATDRSVTEDGEYTGERSKRNGLHYGHVVVGIPSRHKKGVKDYPQRDEEADPLQHIVILSIDTELRDDKQGFVRLLGEGLNPKTEGDDQPQVFMANEVLLFIHGYNVHHKDAIKSAAQLKHDLEFHGLTIAYTWSSKGNKRAYLQDEQEIGKTVGCLQDFIKTILNNIPGKPAIHIVAHSMGNRALIKALHNILLETPLPSTMRNVVFAAADESRERFDNMLREFRKQYSQSIHIDHQQSNGGLKQDRSKKYFHSPQLTVYSSTGDWALFGSKLWHGLQNRLGDTRSFLETTTAEEGSDLVDVSGREITKSWLHHSYYGKIPEVLQDIAELLLQNWNADVRSRATNPRIKPVTFKLKSFYAFRPNEWDRQGCV